MALRKLDLVGTISDLISIDEFEPKTGTNNELIVIAFYAIDEDPAKDLDSFLERSHINTIDVEVSPNPNDDGYYLVFIELKRNKEFFATFYSIIKDVERIAGKQDWKVSPYLSDKMFNVNDDRWEKYVIIEPEKYITKKELEDKNKKEKASESIVEHFRNSCLSDLKISGNNITFVGNLGKVDAKLLAFCTTDKLNESFDMSEQIEWTPTTIEVNILKEALGAGWQVCKQGGDILIFNDWATPITRIRPCY